MSALAFTVMALVLSGPVPAMLARASWPMRAPRAAIVLWRSIALAAVLSNAVNNLPAVLVLLPLVSGPPAVLAVLQAWLARSRQRRWWCRSTETSA